MNIYFGILETLRERKLNGRGGGEEKRRRLHVRPAPTAEGDAAGALRDSLLSYVN